MEDLPKIFEPSVIEPKLMELWQAADLFSRCGSGEDCTVVIPPPNVTGILHMGHAMDDTIQDCYIRYARMRGRSTRWILGTDHAGIATQTQVDKKLKREGISKDEIGREKFLDACWDWTHQYGGTIVEQIKRMGCSIDYADEKFTMSDEFSRAVRRVFCDWYHDGLIYRGSRIVNWCPQCTTAISDDEAEYREEEGRLWYLRYPLTEPVDGREYITVATTRPETMLGDTGIAVSPSDPGKAALIGHTVELPIVNRRIPIFADWHVDAAFGTGFVKVTPAHDPNDFAMGEAHGLDQINIFDEHAMVVEGFGEFSGMDRDCAREAVIRWFDEHGLLEKTEDHTHSVMHCYRCGTTLEPWLSEQWFVAVDKLKGPATEAVRSGAVSFHPARWADTYFNWMENLKDWCISRQLWWGHRIPVFYCDSCGWLDASMEDLCRCPECGGALRQDEDVLDTWFSSQLWTFATQGWPDDVGELSGHHPTKVLVTARDIIALWVARMIMSSLYFTHQVPFHDVYIYATILAKDGSRMSKSKGNGVDPMDLMDKYGADAMRHNLLSLITNNQDVKFDALIDKKTHELVESPRTAAAKSFVTKIWNAARFVRMNLDGFKPATPKAVTSADAWMFSRLARRVDAATSQLETYDFGGYARDMQSFFWNEVCDWYIELCKGRLLSGTAEEKAQVQNNLVFVLDVSLRLLHPDMPFITEYVWDLLPRIGAAGSNAEYLMVSAWPEAGEYADFIDEEAERSFELLRAAVGAVRSTRARFRISPKESLSAQVCADPAVCASFEGLGDLASRLANAHFTTAAAASSSLHAVRVHAGSLEVIIELGDLVDLAAEKAHLAKKLIKAEKDLGGIERTLLNDAFIARASAAVVQKKREQKAELEAEIAALRQEISSIA